MIIPLWDLVSVIFDINTPQKVNDPKSNVAYLLGSFFIIKRRILEEVGAFESVCQAIQEDKALGICIKKMGYNLKIVKLNEMVLVNWSRGLSTLWHGIGGRTLGYLGMRNKVKVIEGLLIIFFVSTLPFILLPYTFSIAIQKFSLSIHILEFIFQFEFNLLLLNIIACIMVTIGVAVKCKAYRLSPVFSLLAFFAAIFLIVSCFYNIAPLLIAGKTHSINWKGRKYVYEKEQEGSSSSTILQSPAMPSSSSSEEIMQSKTEINIPLKREDVVISKKSYMKEERVINKKPLNETRTVTERMKSEKVKVKGTTGEEEK
jgi:hypothetical protein